MRMPRLVTIVIILLLALFPAVVYAATDHSHGADNSGAATNSAGAGTPAAGAQGADQHMQQMMNMMSGQGAAGGHGENSADEGHESSGGHGGESKKNVLEPFKNQIVAGFAGLNLLVIAAALVMKKKLGQGV